MTPPRAELPQAAAARWLSWSVAFVWLATGVLVLHPFYREVGSERLGALGLPDGLMFATCAAEVGLGLWVALRPPGSWVTLLQVGLVLGFTTILAVQEPALLAHPFGVLSKNLPLLAAVVVAWWVHRDGWTPGAEWLLRAGMAVIWITEGLFPKVLFQDPMELEVVVRSGLVPGDPSRFLTFMGGCQIASGVLALTLRGRALTLLLACQCLALLALPLLVSWQQPTLWAHPFGPLTKNVPILVGTAVVLLRVTPFLSARWSHLLLFTWAVPAERLSPHLPPGTSLDLRDGDACLSFVSLDFSETRVLGVPWPGFTRFPDLNLRFYARHGSDPGVVFVRELVPHRLTAWVARTLFREPFDSAPIESGVSPLPEGRLHVVRRFERGGRRHEVHAVAREAAEVPPAESDAHFFKERYLGFGRTRAGSLLRYRVEHPPWAVHSLDSWRLDVDWEAVYGPEWSFLADLEPRSVLLASGSTVEVWFEV